MGGASCRGRCRASPPILLVVAAGPPKDPRLGRRGTRRIRIYCFSPRLAKKIHLCVFVYVYVYMCVYIYVCVYIYIYIEDNPV